MTEPETGHAPRKPLYKNPFLIGFVLGAMVLTALPLLQRRFLKAPPPIASLSPFSLVSARAGRVTDATLHGKVWLLQLLPPGCPEGCGERAERFGRMAQHVDDLKGAIQLVSVVLPFSDGGAPGELVSKAQPGWLFLSGAPAEVEAFAARVRAAFVGWAHADGGATVADFSALPAVVVVDQNGALRGFWKDDSAGRGNAVNAARLLARYGPAP